MKDPFENVSDEYDEWYTKNPRILSLEREAIGLMGLKGRGLDVGCGTGVLTPSGALCLDPSLPMLRKARERGLATVIGSGEDLPFRDESFDFAIMTASLCFMRSPISALIQSARVLKAGGKMVACIIPRDSPWGIHYVEKGEKGHPIYSHARFITVAEAFQMMDEASLKPDLMASALHFPPGASLSGDAVQKNDGTGGFVCIRGRKLLKRAVARR